MEIIKKGIFNRECTCNICECVFRYYASDIYVDTTNNNKPYVECPECRKIIYLKEEELWKI